MNEGEIILFADCPPGVEALYLALTEAVRVIAPDMAVEEKKTQINFRIGTIFACVSRLAVRPKTERQEPWLTVTFGLGHPVASPRIAVCTEAAPGRFTHHLLLGRIEEIDDELLGWLVGAAAFSSAKRPRGQRKR